MKDKPEYKEYTLLTWEEFEKKFRPEAEEWRDRRNGSNCIYIRWNGIRWAITKTSVERFGTTVKARKKLIGIENNFTHEDIDGRYRYHESWFEPEDFIKEEEFII